MSIDFYYYMASPPCRSVMMMAEAVGVTLNFLELQQAKPDHLKAELLALNPQHTCPTIDDGGFAVWESRAILQYLASKYDQSGTLYPEDLQIRTMINQKLFFDMELNAKVSDYFYPQIMGGAPADAAKLQKLLDFLGFLDTALDGKAYIVGDALTIADISLINTLSMLELLNIDFGQFQNIPAYMEKCKATTPGYDGIASKSLEAFAVFANKLN